MCKKRSALCLGAFPFDSHLEFSLQNGSIFSICKNACNLSVVSDFDVVLGASVTSGVTASDGGCGGVLSSSTSGVECRSIRIGGR